MHLSLVTRIGRSVFNAVMTPSDANDPDDLESLKRLLVAERAARFEAEAKAALATAQVSGAEAVIAHLKLAIASSTAAARSVVTSCSTR